MLASAAVVFSLGACPLVQGAPAQQQQAAEKAKDPVCGMEVEAAKAEKLTHEGKTYYFCSKTCKAKFEKNPAQYTKPAPQKKS